MQGDVNWLIETSFYSGWEKVILSVDACEGSNRNRRRRNNFFFSGRVTVEIGKRKKISNTFKQIVFQDIETYLRIGILSDDNRFFSKIDHSKLKGHELKPRVIESSETKIAIKCSWCFKVIGFYFCFELTTWIWKVLWTGNETFWKRKKLPLKKCLNWKMANDTEWILLVKVWSSLFHLGKHRSIFFFEYCSLCFLFSFLCNRSLNESYRECQIVWNYVPLISMVKLITLHLFLKFWVTSVLFSKENLKKLLLLSIVLQGIYHASGTAKFGADSIDTC